MRIVACLLLIVAGLALRSLSLAWHEQPRGDVVLDVGVARSLAQGQGFGSGFVRGTVFAHGDDPAPRRDQADQHAPLWGLIGARLSGLGLAPFSALKLGSLLCALALLWLVWRQTERLCESIPNIPDGLAPLATALAALSFVLVDAAGNGSLYGPQALGVLLLVAALGRYPRQSAVQTGLQAGLVVGLLWLLNHQALVLLAVPPLVLLAAARPGQRGQAAWGGLLALLVAVTLQAPWWWRNAQIFGDPLFSANAFYVLHHAGVPITFELVDGLPLARFAPASLLATLLAKLPEWGRANALYLLVTGSVVWPAIFGVVAAGSVVLWRAAWRGRDGRLLAALAVLGLLAAITLLWPDAKQRYLVPLTPLVIVLGVRLLAAPPQRGERLGALAVCVIWLAAVVLTRSDGAGLADDARPERWRMLTFGGLALLVLPLAVRHLPARWLGSETRLAVCSGLLFLPLICAAAFWQPPHTTYHSSPVTKDIFGQLKDREEAALMVTLQRARDAAREQGARVLVAPVEFLAFPEPALVSLPVGPLGQRDEALVALLERAEVNGQRPDHVLLPALAGWPEALRPGDVWLDGRLEVVTVWEPTQADPLRGAMLCRVLDAAPR